MNLAIGSAQALLLVFGLMRHIFKKIAIVAKIAKPSL